MVSSRRQPKVKRVGYRLRVQRAGEDKLERVGFLFRTRDEARAHATRYYASAQRYTIEGVRINTVPLYAPAGRTAEERVAKA